MLKFHTKLLYKLINFYLVSKVIFEIFSKSPVNPYMRPPGRTNNITEPLMARLMNDIACNSI